MYFYLPTDSQIQVSQYQQQAEISESLSPVQIPEKPQAVENLVNDHLSEFELDIEFDKEIEEMAKHRNQFEEEVDFSKKGLIETIESLIEKEQSEEESKKWELKLNKDDVKVYIKKGGSKHNPDQPYIRTEVLFNSYMQMNKILNTVKIISIDVTERFQIFSETHRKQWDKNILKYELTPVGNNVVMNYQLNKAPLNFQNRDFLDKQIKFSNDGKFYCYYSSIPNDTDIKQVPEKVGRALTYIGVQKMERRAEDGRIKYVMLMQCDLKMNITPKLIGMFLPQGMQDWSRKINKYLMDHYDKI